MWTCPLVGQERSGGAGTGRRPQPGAGEPVKRRAQPGALDLLEVEPANPKTEKGIHVESSHLLLVFPAFGTVPKSIIR